MRKILLIILFINFTSYGQQWEWAFKTVNIDIKETAIADDGSIYLVGNFADSCIINGQLITGASTPKVNAILVKFSESGIILWWKLFIGSTSLECLATENNKVYIGGFF